MARIRHSAVTTPIYELVKTVELTLQLEDSWDMRFEIFADTESPGHYRARLWQHEFHRLRPSFPQDDNGEPKDVQDAVIPIEWSNVKIGDYRDIQASSPDEALELVLNDFKQFLEHVTLEKPED